MKNLFRRMMLVMVLAIAGIIATQTSAMSQTSTCIIVGGCKLLIVFDPCGNIISSTLDCGSTGTGVFTTRPQVQAQPEDNGENNLNNDDPPTDEQLNVTLDPESISATLPTADLGILKTTLDKSRISPPTTVISNTDESRFPATATLQFYANATTDAGGTTVYTSREPLVFVSDNVNSFDPFNNEVFTLANNVDFYDPKSETKSTVFRLEAGETTVTLGSAAGEERNDDLR